MYSPAPHKMMNGVVRPAGLEPATPCLEGRCSIHLSYGRIRAGVPVACFCCRAREKYSIKCGCRGWPHSGLIPPRGGEMAVGSEQ